MHRRSGACDTLNSPTAFASVVSLHALKQAAKPARQWLCLRITHQDLIKDVNENVVLGTTP